MNEKRKLKGEDSGIRTAFLLVIQAGIESCEITCLMMRR